MIRIAEPGDLQAAAEIEKLSFEHPWSFEDLKKDFEDNPFSLFLVCEQDGQIQAYADIWIMFENAQIARIACKPEFRRQGLARKLIEAAVEEARSREAENFSLEVRAGNKPAIALYEAMGFILLHTAKNYYEGVEDALVMGLGI